MAAGILALSIVLLAAPAQPAPPEPARGTGESCCDVVELRQYTVRPGRREDLIELFDGTFADPLDATGMTIIGQFRDLDRPDRFVWIRGFPTMEARPRQLAAFYDSDLWHARRGDANALIDDSDNVLLLEAASPALSFRDIPPRTTHGADASAGLVVVTLYYTQRNGLPQFGSYFEQTLRPRAERAGARTLAVYATSMQANNFPRLAIRTGEQIFVWVTGFASPGNYAAYQATLDADREWTQAIWPAVRAQLTRDPEVLRLTPTPRSRLRE